MRLWNGLASARTSTQWQRGYVPPWDTIFSVSSTNKYSVRRAIRSLVACVDMFSCTQKLHNNCRHMHISVAIDGDVADIGVRAKDGGSRICNGSESQILKSHEGTAEDGGALEVEVMEEDQITHLCKNLKGHLSWNRQVTFHVRRQQIRQAILVCNRMLQESTIPDKSTYILLLSARCSNPLVLRFAIQVHSLLSSLEIDVQSDTILRNVLISLYGRCNCLDCSRIVFCNLFERNVVSWNAMISALVQQDQGQEALHLFNQMKQEGVMGNTITFVSTLHACSCECALQFGMQLHAGIAACLSTVDVFLGTALVSMYAKCACMDKAERFFEEMPNRSVISWNTMISAYARHGQGKIVVILFYQLQKVGFIPTVATFVSIISTFSSPLDLHKGKQVHALVMGELFESNISIGTALVSMYRRCGNVSSARTVFDAMRKHDQGSWNAIIATYVHYSIGNEAFQLLIHMITQGVFPNKTTYSSILSTCSHKTTLFEGIQLHALIMHTSLQKDLLVGNALVSMYGKCGCLDQAQRVFDKMDERNTVTWNAMLDAHALHGKSDDLFRLYEQMRCDQIPPDNMTFTSMLTLCSRLGLVDEAREFFLSMSKDFGLAPSRDHFNCVIDLLGRAGKLDEAETLLNNMPISHCAVSMRTLLGACRSQTDVNRGERAARQVVSLDPKSTCPYMILSSLYGSLDENGATPLKAALAR
ncbi:hypothetical protein L7F22_063195 [Adiantum nelumboides]|nr:hypothetical protein [Adiantum nelumboides]